MASTLPKLIKRSFNSNNLMFFKRMESVSAITAYQSIQFSSSSPKSITSLPSTSHVLQSKSLSNYSSLISSSSQRRFYSSSDSSFSNLLMEEIKAEKERMLDLPQVSQGWKLSRNGADCKLSKMLNQDSVTVSFNVNASIPPLQSEDQEEQEIVAQPDFTVEIKKPSSESLSFECFYPDDDLENEEMERDNVFSIRSVILHRGEVVESTYVMDTENVDPNLYENMLTYLKDRGIGNDFAEEIVDVATAIENHEYISSLEKLHNFVSSK